MRKCFVPFCNIKNKDQPNRTMFSVPREQTLLAQWAEVLPKVRSLKYTDKVCYLHFMPDDVVSTFDHCINGQIYKIKRDRPKLKPDSVPCLRMATKDELLSYRLKPSLTSNPKVVGMSDDNKLTDQIYDLIADEPEQTTADKIIYDKIQLLEEVENNDIILEDNIRDFDLYEVEKCDEVRNEIGDVVIEKLKSDCEEMDFTKKDSKDENLLMTKRFNLFNLLYDNAYETLTPNTLWGIHRCPNRTFICFSYMKVSNMEITKMVCIKSDGSVQLLIDGNAVKTWRLLEDIDNLDDLSIILNRVNIWHLCPGKLANSNCEITVEPNDDICWIDEDNAEILFCKMCLQIK